MTPTTLTRKISKAYEPFGPLEGINLQRAVALLGNPAGKTLFFESLISPVLGRAEKAEDWYVASSHGSSDGSSVQVFVWPPGTGTRVHDHSSWGAFRCVSGSVLEVRYARRDDGSKIEHARLREIWRRLLGQERWGLDRPALRGRHSPTVQPRRRDGDLRASLRSPERRDRRQGLRPFPRLCLRPAGGVRRERMASVIEQPEEVKDEEPLAA